jgi:hypothetical protein
MTAARHPFPRLVIDLLDLTTGARVNQNPEKDSLAISKKTEPADLLRHAATSLRRPLEGVFSLAFAEPQQTTREKGLYGFLYGKPIRRFASALSIDRELLILFSTFASQQQRTVKVARELIAETEGRLEKTICIVVHSDPEGNAKLPKWGRNVGLAVLPIYAGRMPVTVEELENHLCHELFSHDPFDVTGPVSDDENFYGRRNEALDLARKLQKGQIRSSLGIRKIGKTSVMNRVISEASVHHDCYCVLADCSRDELWTLDAAGLMQSLAVAIRKVKDRPDRYITVSAIQPGCTLAQATATLQDAIQATSKPILIFIDEVDYITPGSPTSTLWKLEFNKFWRNFRAVYQETSRDKSVVSVMVSGVSAKWFSVPSIEGIENAALSFIPEEYLSPLPRRAGVGMIKKIARTAGLTVTDPAADYIAAAASDMPFWIRKACSYVHQHIDIGVRPIVLELDSVNKMIEDFSRKEGSTLGQVAITHLFSVYPEIKESAYKLLDGKGGEIPSHFLTVLRHYGLASAMGAPRLSGLLIEAALAAHREHEYSEGPTLGQISEKPKASSALADWAEELAVINKTRNVLEKRLRQLTLNFLRSDSLSNKSKGSAKERILSCISSERRKALVPLVADDLVEKLFWLELLTIVKKEWALFAPIFGDIRLFEDNFLLANDRPDTHAKDADDLDIALQRRSLKWLTDKLAAV